MEKVIMFKTKRGVVVENKDAAFLDDLDDLLCDLLFGEDGWDTDGFNLIGFENSVTFWSFIESLKRLRKEYYNNEPDELELDRRS